MDIKLKFICGEPEGLKREYFVLLSCIWTAFICWGLGAATTRLSNSEFKILWLNFYLEEGKSERGVEDTQPNWLPMQPSISFALLF